MGLRFRKTISILPGVRLNLGKSTQSISVGVPGFRKTFNTKGQVTTTVGLPGTGLYYVDQKNPKKEAQRKKAKQERVAEPRVEREAPRVQRPEASVQRRSSMPDPGQFRRPLAGMNKAAGFSAEKLHAIHKTADDTIDWNEIHAQPLPPDASVNGEMWAYYHSVAADILAGDIDAYLRLIYEVNPLDDLLEYGEEFTFGTDDPARMEVEFSANEAALLPAKGSLSAAEYNNILQDFICSMVIRIARDIFALLPVENTIVHALLRGENVLSVSFDRSTMNQIRFGMIDPSETIARFPHQMNFSPDNGFSPVERME